MFWWSCCWLWNCLPRWLRLVLDQLLADPGQGVALALHYGWPVLVAELDQIHPNSGKLTSAEGDSPEGPNSLQGQRGNPRGQAWVTTASGHLWGDERDEGQGMRDGVGTSLLSGKSESWLGSAHESNKKTCSGEEPTDGSMSCTQ